MKGFFNRVQFYSEVNLHELAAAGDTVRRYCRPMMVEGVQKYFLNVKTELGILQAGDVVVPLTITAQNYSNSYVCSPYTQYISYAREESQLVRNAAARQALRLALNPLGLFFRASGLNHMVSVNNWLLSTNLHPKGLAERVGEVTQFLREHFPDRAISFRSITEEQDPELYSSLQRAGYKLIPAREIYLTDASQDKAFRSRMFRSDLKILQDSDYEVLTGEQLSARDADRMAELYSQLNIEKYSRCNPMYSARFFAHAIEQQLLNFRALRRNGRIDGILAYYSRDGVMTAPCFGYDTSLPQSLGLYRMISTLLLLEARKEGALLNHSGGAGSFKTLRRATPCMEYIAVYDQHLPPFRKVAWTLLHRTMTGPGRKIMENTDF